MRKRGFTQNWEDTMQKWYEWLEEMKKKDDKEKLEEMHQHKVAQMTSQNETSLGEVRKMALSPCAIWAELALCQRCSRRITEKNRDGRRRFHKGGSSPKEKTGPK